MTKTSLQSCSNYALVNKSKESIEGATEKTSKTEKRGKLLGIIYVYPVGK